MTQRNSGDGATGTPVPVYRPSPSVVLGMAEQETRLAALTDENRISFLQEQERRLTHPSIAQLVESHELRPGIAELRSKFSDEPGMKDKPDGPELPIQRVYDQNGRVLLEGHANSVQDLIQNNLKSCAESTDPAKRQLNLTGANLSTDQNGQPLHLQFSCFNFQNINMDGANLGGAGFDRCQFRNASMNGANIKDTSFMICHFEQTDMAGCSGNSNTMLRNSSLYGVNMSGADLPGVKMHNLRGQYVDWSGANMAGAGINNVAIENLDARAVNLAHAGIGGLSVTGEHSTFDGASFEGATIGGSHFGTSQQLISMRALKASGSHWSQSTIAADLSYSDMSGASFDGLDIRASETPDGPIHVEGCTLGGLAHGRLTQLYPPERVAAAQLNRSSSRF